MKIAAWMKIGRRLRSNCPIVISVFRYGAAEATPRALRLSSPDSYCNHGLDI